MKTASLLLYTLIWLCGPTHSQKLGYKDFQIGKQINDTAFKKYDLREMKSDSTTYGLFSDTMIFCDIPLQLILLHIDSSKTIDNTQIHTQEILFDNYKSFRNKFFSIVDCMTNFFGKPDALDLDNKKLKKYAFWNLKNVHVVLSLSVDDMSTFAENQKKIFIITWTYKKDPKLW